jgi:hypothetical protein
MDVEQFEGLVKETAAQIVAGGVEMEFDDVCQLLRVKAWLVAQKFDAATAAQGKRLGRPDRHGRTPMQRWVFLCLVNFRRDLEKRPRRFTASIDDLRDNESDPTGGRAARADRFDAKYLATEDCYEFEDDPSLPPDLTETERQVIALKLAGRHLFQIDHELGLTRAERQRVMESIRAKLSHLDPAPQRSGPMRPLPAGELPLARVLAAIAA